MITSSSAREEEMANRSEIVIGRKRKGAEEAESSPSTKALFDKKKKKGKKSAKQAASFGDALASVLNKTPKESEGPIVPTAKDKNELEKRQREDKKEKEAARLTVAKQKWFQKEHIVPDAAEGNHEKMLVKLATRGVVKLFNAVQQQQKQRIEEKGKDVIAPKPDKLTKGQFLDLLKKGGKDAGANEDHQAAREDDNAAMSKKQNGRDEKHDEEEDEDEEEEEEEEEEMEMESDSGGEMEANSEDEWEED